MEMGYRCTAQGEGTGKLPRASLRAVIRLILESLEPMPVAGPGWGKMTETAGKQRKAGLFSSCHSGAPDASDWQNLRTPLVREACGLLGHRDPPPPPPAHRLGIYALEEAYVIMLMRRHIQGLSPRAGASQSLLSRSTKGLLPRNGFPKPGLWVLGGLG